MPPVSLHVPASHPSLPGHFPGNPIVPGALLLSLAIDALQTEFGPFLLAGLPKVRFLQPLCAEQVFRVEGEQRTTGSLRFRCVRDEAVIAEGVLRIDPRCLPADLQVK